MRGLLSSPLGAHTVAHDEFILVLGATGQQGGSVATALLRDGWRVRALVRDTGADKVKAIAAQGVTPVAGDLSDTDTIRSAMAGAYGVFVVLPSSGQGAAYGVTDAQEVYYGTMLADIAAVHGIRHLVYSSANAAGPTLTGVGHFDSKSDIEAHLRTLDVRSTIIRPSAFMEILTLPGMGLDTGTFSFFMRPDQPMQFIAVEDIGRIVAVIFADPITYGSKTIEIAGDAVTGRELAAAFSRAAGRPIDYQRFPDSLLQENAFLGSLARLVDEGRLAGHADLPALRHAFPGLLSLPDWLQRAGGPALTAALQAEGSGIALR